MGCCLSRPVPGPVSPSARALNIPPPSPVPGPPVVPSRTRTPPSASSRPRRSVTVVSATSSSHGPLDAHINSPLRRHVWVSSTTRSLPRRPDARGARTHIRPTQTNLVRERADYFDTRVTGRPEVWAALRWVASILLGDRSDSSADGLETAQGILDAVGITVPTGDLGDGGAYDEAGNFYPVPGWLVADPPSSLQVGVEVDSNGNNGNNGDDDDDARTQRGADDEGKRRMVTSEDKVELDEEDDELARRRETKGKGVLDVCETVKLVARLSETSRDISLRVGKEETVRSVARRIAEDACLGPSKKVRMAYMGMMLKETSPLLSQGWQRGHIVNALVFNTQS